MNNSGSNSTHKLDADLALNSLDMQIFSSLSEMIFFSIKQMFILGLSLL